MPSSFVIVLTSWLTIWSFSPFSAVAAGHFQESPVAGCILKSLDEFEESKEHLPKKVPLPSVVGLPDIKKDQVALDFNVCVQWFRAEWTSDILKRLRSIAKSVSAGELSAEELASMDKELTGMRASLKFLRFLFTSLDKDHGTPKAFDELATAVGKLRDGTKRLDPSEWPKLGKRVLRATSPSEMKKIEKEIAGFKPASGDNFKEWLKATLAQTEKILTSGHGTGRDWHQARKNLQAILSVYKLELLKDPNNPDFKSIVAFLLKETELMGDEVGVHERAAIAGKIDYEEDLVPYPAGLVSKLLDFLRIAQN